MLLGFLFTFNYDRIFLFCLKNLKNADLKKKNEEEEEFEFFVCVNSA